MRRRTYLWLFMITMALYTFQRDEKPMMYLYTQLKFNWDTAIYSNYRTFQSSAYVLMMLTGIPLMSRIFGWTDTVIIGMIVVNLYIYLITTAIPSHPGDRHDWRDGPRHGPLLLRLCQRGMGAVSGSGRVLSGPDRGPRAPLDDIENCAFVGAGKSIRVTVRVR